MVILLPVIFKYHVHIFREGFMGFDILIKNGTIIDGTGGLRYKSDLGITGGKISAIGSLEEAEAGMVIDGTGLVVSPG